MVLVSHEDLMTSQDCASWELNGGQHVEIDPSKSVCQKIWEALNSKTANCFIILITLLEGLIILVELLIDLKIIQDPYSNTLCSNSTYSGGDSSNWENAMPSSRNLQVAKDILSYTSVILLAIFLIEILFRILSGRGKFLKQTADICDGMIVVLAFSLDLAFLLTSENTSDGKLTAIFIILLRLWRISRLLKSIVHDAKREMGHIIIAYKRDKIQAEHKVEILILKVEDLEHEVAYLKEKLKKTEKEAATQKKRKNRDMGCDGDPLGLNHDMLHCCLTNPSSPHDATPWKSVPVLSFSPLPTPTSHHHLNLLSSPINKLGSTSPIHASLPAGLHSPIATSPSAKQKSPRRRKSHDGAALQEFVKTTVDRILKSASMELDTITEEGVKDKRSLRVEQHDSGRGSCYTPRSTPRVNTLQRNDSIGSGRGSPLYSMPAIELLQTDDNKAPDCEDQTHNAVRDIDELSEIERVTKVEFNSIEGSMDIPVTAL